MRQLQKPHQQLHLLHTLLALQVAEKRLPRILILVILRQQDILHPLRNKPLPQLLVHHHNTPLHHPADRRHHLLQTQRTAQLRHTHHRMLAQLLHHHPFILRQTRKVAAERRVNRHSTLARQLQPRRQRHRHHITLITHIIPRHPLPKLHLPLTHHRLLVQHRHHILRHPRRRILVHTPHNSRIQPAALRSELHHHAHAHSHLTLQLARNPVSVSVAQMQRQQHISKIWNLLLHPFQTAKIQKFSRNQAS